jgi:hypothetical protein
VRVHVYVAFNVPSKENKNLGNLAATSSSNIKIQLLLSFFLLVEELPLQFLSAVRGSN